MIQKSQTGKCFIAAMGIVGFVATTSSAKAEGWATPPIAGNTKLHFDITRRMLPTTMIDLKERGRIVIDVERYNTRGCVSTCETFVLISAPNPEKLQWHLEMPKHDGNRESYNEVWKKYRDRKYRLADMEFVKPDGTRRTIRNVGNIEAALFIQNPKQKRWASLSKLTPAKFAEEYEKRVRNGGMTLVDHEAYTIAGKPYHSAIFSAGQKPNILNDWGISISDYGKLAQIAYDRDNIRPIYLNAGCKGYCTTLVRDPDISAKVFTRMTLGQLKNRKANLKRQGYQLMDLEYDRRNSPANLIGIWMRKKES